MTQPNNRKLARRWNKQPWLAVNLSLLFPGIGQIYAGKLLKGIVFMVSEIILSAIAVRSIFSPAGNTVTGLSFLIPIVGIYVFNLFDASQSVPKTSESLSPEILPTYSSFTLHPSSAIKDPWLAVFFSQILPGLGQLYLEKFFFGGSFLAGMVIFANLANLFSPLLIVPPILYAIASYHAYIATPSKPPRSKRLIILLVAAILALKLTITYLPNWVEQRIDIFTIPSNSMLPTLQEGDCIFVDKSSNYFPKKGDLIVFLAPKNAQRQDVTVDTFFVKRVIGEPGQIVEVKNRVVYLNDQPLQEDYIAETPAYEWGPETVPASAYLVLGDNRNDSFDSHIWGFLPASNIVGKAYKIYWPPARIRPL